MLEVKGPAVTDIARHLYQEINDPKQPFPRYTFGQTIWPNPPIEIYHTNTQIQTLFTAGPAGAINYGYYSNWAPKGEISILAATLKAIRNAKQYIFISDQFLWNPVILDAVAQQLQKVQAVVLVTDSFNTLDHYILGYNLKTMANAKAYYQFRAWSQLAKSNKVFAYQLIKEGLPEANIKNTIYTHWKALIIDDEFAIIGTAGVEQAGMTNDIDMSLGIYDPAVVKTMRENLWAEYLNVSDPMTLSDPIATIQSVWPDTAVNAGRVRAYWPPNIPHKSIYDVIYKIFEPCGYIDAKQCETLGF
jgi:phosphatidylserine/phosphatidylglycerophosphate/cardiolipin synthase-like enzyme